jgi:hypothetical protein
MNSKNRTRPSKVYSRSMDGANHHRRIRDHDKMAEKHWTGPRPQSTVQCETSDQSN